MAAKEYFIKKKRRVIGKTLAEAEIKTAKSWLSVHKSSKDDMVTYESEGLIASVNGSGTLAIDHAQCKEARKFAAFIKESGGIIMNGGRTSGIMEASSSSAGEASMGIIFPEIKKDSNKHGEKVIVNSPQPRIELLSTCAPVMVIFRGGLGTFMVLLRSIVHIKNRQYHPEQLPQIVFISNYWMGLLSTMMNLGTLPREFLVELKFFSTAEQIIKQMPPFK